MAIVLSQQRCTAAAPTVSTVEQEATNEEQVENPSSFCIADSSPYIEVPVIRLDDPNEERLGAALRKACEFTGFFYVEGHGIAQMHLDLLLNATKAFFSWSLEDKKYASETMKQYHDAFRTSYQHDERNKFDFIRQRPRTEDRVNLLYGNSTDPMDTTEWTNVTSWPHVREIWLDYFDDLSIVSYKLASLMSKYVLRMDEATDESKAIVNKLFLEDPSECLRLNHYTNTMANHFDHTDRDFITIVQTDREGLHVFVDGAWKKLPLRTDALFINLGDFLERWTNGQVKATRHRVSMAGNTDRYSSTFFFSPIWEASISPLWHFQTPEEQITGNMLYYPPVLISEYTPQTSSYPAVMVSRP